MYSKGQKASIKDVSFKPDSRYITTAAANTIFIYDLEGNEEGCRAEQQDELSVGFVFSSDGKTFISGNYDGILYVCMIFTTCGKMG